MWRERGRQSRVVEDGAEKRKREAGRKEGISKKNKRKKKKRLIKSTGKNFFDC